VTRAITVAVLGAVLAYGCEKSSPVVQPIQFNHKAHIDSGLPCDSCHASVRTAASAGVPRTDMCMMCHQVALTESTEEEKVRHYAENGEQIPWRRIYDVPDHVYFSHRRHVAVAGIECVECHGAVPTLVVPAAYPLVDQSMDWCLECHQARGATEDCVHCHR
jgi:predicted CXXCH cytochrome family protein